MARTKKAKSAGRFGPRYGRKIRLRVREVESQYKGKLFICPNCSKKKLYRLATAIWHCSKCQVKLAGGAYAPFMRTEAIKTEGKIVSVEEFKEDKETSKEVQ